MAALMIAVRREMVSSCEDAGLIVVTPPIPLHRGLNVEVQNWGQRTAEIPDVGPVGRNGGSASGTVPRSGERSGPTSHPRRTECALLIIVEENAESWHVSSK